MLKQHVLRVSECLAQDVVLLNVTKVNRVACLLVRRVVSVVCRRWVRSTILQNFLFFHEVFGQSHWRSCFLPLLFHFFNLSSLLLLTFGDRATFSISDEFFGRHLLPIAAIVLVIILWRPQLTVMLLVLRRRHLRKHPLLDGWEAQGIALVLHAQVVCRVTSKPTELPARSQVLLLLVQTSMPLLQLPLCHFQQRDYFLIAEARFHVSWVGSVLLVQCLLHILTKRWWRLARTILSVAVFHHLLLN